MARRLAVLLLLLALGCLLGILLLLLGSGDTRGPPGFKVSGTVRGRREVLGCRGPEEPPWVPRCMAFPVCGITGAGQTLASEDPQRHGRRRS